MTSSSSVDQFILKLKRRQLTGAHAIAIETAIFLRQYIQGTIPRTASAALQISMIKEVAREMIKAAPFEFVIGNVVRRVLHLIREEYRAISKLGSSGESQRSSTNVNNIAALGDSVIMSPSTNTESPMYNMMANIAAVGGHAPIDYSKSYLELSQALPSGIQEIMDEIDGSRSNIAAQALEHIHTNEIVMTLGRSEAVEQFLLAAGRKRQFQVFIAEAAPKCTGHLLAKTLAEAGIETLLIPDAAIFAMMARVNKVIIGCHAVTANGGIVGMSGAQIMASAGFHHSTPVVVLTPMYKLTPLYPEHDATFNLLANPDAILSFGDVQLADEVINPMYDYCPPELISLFITNAGGHPPSYVYRLLGELYDQEDYKLDTVEGL